MNIDFNRLSRDFSNKPIEPKEGIEKSDLLYLFIELNLTKREVAKVLGTNEYKVFMFCKKYDIHKTQQQITASQKESFLRKTGKSNPMQIEENKQKCANSFRANYKLRGAEIREKTKQTCLRKYGVDNPSKCNEIKKKKEETCLKNYGVSNPNKSSEIREKIAKTCKEKNGGFTLEKSCSSRGKYEETIRQKYNCINPMKNEQIAKKTSNTLKENKSKIIAKNRSLHGVDWPAQLQATKDKINNTKDLNKSHNTSKIENDIFQMLLLKFDDTKRNFKSSLYPFSCDFYIPCLDLYIEFNGTWTHGYRPFENNEQCRIQLSKWAEKAKNSNYYKNAIYTWTDLDVRKRKVAKENNLNYLVFYSIKEFTEWYGQLP